ncbi:MAG: glycosyltransferase family 2 protein [Bacteroidales bacterium]|nr:glycosyltransferase family 2 protein [Bacteroidales bacterium]
MLEGKTIGVVIPAYNEEYQIEMVIGGIPDFVDRIVLINDHSKDGTSEVVRKLVDAPGNRSAHVIHDVEKPPPRGIYSAAEELIWERNREEIRFFKPSAVYNRTPWQDRLILIDMAKNSGVGAAIARGYKWCKDHGIDCTAVMAGDGQMDPGELESICMPVVRDGVDYVKGNRLKHPSAFAIIPAVRFWGNSILSILTKMASGYWSVSDTQTGYTAISAKALNSIKLYRIYPSYGMPNDMLVRLNIAYCTLREVTVKPVYRVGERSKLRVFKVLFPIGWLLFRSFFKRLWIKYLFRDFHPLFLLYHLGLILLACALPFLVSMLSNALKPGFSTPQQSLIFFIFLTITGLQSLLFAMWMDFQDNERLLK